MLNDVVIMYVNAKPGILGTSGKPCRWVHADSISIRPVHDHTPRILKGVSPETTPLRVVSQHTVRLARAAHNKVRVSRAAGVLIGRVVAKIH